jgi:hypothetical protein
VPKSQKDPPSHSCSLAQVSPTLTKHTLVGHGLNLFGEELNYIGKKIGIVKHLEYEVVVVLDFVGGIRDKGTLYYNKDNFKFNLSNEVNHNESKIRIKTPLQMTDKDAPSNAVSVKIIKKLNNDLSNGGIRRVTQKIYELNDGTQYIVEIEDI